jgi:RNA polymerase sigma factor for flagellar operon FliA
MDVQAAPDIDEAALWQRTRDDGDMSARERLLALHLPYARVVAASYYGRRFHDEIEFGDYLQLASLGLIEAMDRFDPARGVQFRTFAARRMHGAILSGIERLTEKQQQIAARQRLRAERLQDLKPAGGAAPQGAEQLLCYVSEVGIGLALCWMLEGTAMVDLPDANGSAPFYQSVALRQLRDRLLGAVEALPPQERTVVRSHYLQDMQFDEIAAMLQLTKGRISQIHKQALLRLRSQVRDHADWNLEL